MVKSNKRLAAAEHEFALLENVLNQTADDAARCLKLLKKNLSDYDHHHGHHFVNTATSHMRNDMRSAKDTASNLKHVAHQIRETPQPSEAGIISARSMMDVVAKSMDALSTTARNYDEKNGRSKGVGGLLEKVDGIHHHGGGDMLSSSDTVEQLVKTTLHSKFSISALSHQITIAEKSLSSSPSFVERAKEAIHDVKDRLKGDKASPTHVDHHGNKNVVAS